MGLRNVRRIGVEGKLAIFAIDPGGTTGWSAGLFEGGGKLVDIVGRSVNPPAMSGRDLNSSSRRIVGGQLEGSEKDQVERLVHLWQRMVQAWSPSRAILVSEDFRLRGRGSDATLLSPVRILQRLEVAHEQGRFHPAFELVKQQPSEAKGAVNDALLKSMGIYYRGEKHRRDAARHMVLRLMKELEA